MYRVSLKNPEFCGLAITPIWKVPGTEEGGFRKIQEILYMIDTKILQFDLLEAEKIGSKIGTHN